MQRWEYTVLPNFKLAYSEGGKKKKHTLSYNYKYPVKPDFDFLRAAKQQRVRDEPCGTERMMLDWIMAGLKAFIKLEANSVWWDPSLQLPAVSQPYLLAVYSCSLGAPASNKQRGYKTCLIQKCLDKTKAGQQEKSRSVCNDPCSPPKNEILV